MKNPLWSLRKRLCRFRSSPQIVWYRNAKFVLDPREGLDKKIIAGQPFESEHIRHAISKIVERKIDTIVDVGANFGLYTVLLGRIPTVRAVTSFEPVTRTYNQLCANVFANDIDSKTCLHHCGLGNSEGDATIYIQPWNSGLSRLVLASQSDEDKFSRIERIKIVKGDNVLTYYDQQIFMKIDVEDYAMEALEGLSHTLEANRGVIQVEVKAAERNVFEFLNARGWRNFLQMPTDAFFCK